VKGRNEMLDMRISLKKIAQKIEDKAGGKSLSFVTPDNTVSQGTFIANLALQYARKGERVLILDTDTERNVFCSAFHLKKELGLLQFFSHHEDSSQKYLQEVFVTEGSLFVLCAGEGTEQDMITTMKSSGFSTLFAGLESKFDRVFLNIKPQSSITKVMPALEVTDGTIVTIEKDFTRKKLIHKLIKQLLLHDQPTVGYITIQRK